MYDYLRNISITIWDFIINTFLSLWSNIEGYLEGYMEGNVGLYLPIIGYIIVSIIVLYLLKRAIEYLLHLFKIIQGFNKKNIFFGLLIFSFLLTLIIYIIEKR